MMSKSMYWIALSGLLALLVGGSACDKQKLIPKTKIPDTKVNRELISTIVQYRDAMVRRDAAKILTLAHPSYQDMGGRKAEEEIDFERLKTILATRFKRASRVRYRIEFQRVEVRGREAQVDAWIDGTFVYEQPGHRPHYKRLADYNRYRLLNEDGKWLFLSGI